MLLQPAKPLDRGKPAIRFHASFSMVRCRFKTFVLA
jgi:hypothetical protein